jgi:hypothetical protein
MITITIETMEDAVMAKKMLDGYVGGNTQPVEEKEAPAKTARPTNKAKKDVPDLPKVTEETVTELTTSDLTKAAKAAVARGVDRADIKRAVAKYAPALSKVKDEDIAEVLSAIEGL